MATVEATVVTSNRWRHGLFSCFGNIGVCVVTYLVPCYTAGKVAESVGHSCPLYGLCYCVPIVNLIMSCSVRRQIRERQNIPGSCISDLCTVFWCPCCSLIQEAGETGTGLIKQTIPRH